MLSSMSKHSDDDDKQLFRQAMADVRRLETDKAPLAQPRPKPQRRKAEAADNHPINDSLSDAFEPITDGITDELSFSRPGLQKQTLRKLRQGKLAIEAELDLHGLKVDQARQVLFNFIQQSRDAGKRCVRVIHGKGRNTDQGHGVLKINTNRWLQQIEGVLAFCSTQAKDGGTGAVYVLLKRG